MKKPAAWLLGGTFLLAALFASVMVSDPDTWLHLAGGRLMLEQGSLPSVNTFSWTAGSHPWKNPEWGFDLLITLAHSAGGYLGVSLLQLLLAAGAFALAADAARRRTRGERPRDLLFLLPPVLLGLAASAFRFVPRPELVTFLGLALLSESWERERERALEGAPGRGRFPLQMALLGMAWANAHPGVGFGLAACAAYLLGEAIPRPRPGLAQAARGAGAFLLGSLANPYLAYPYVYSFQHFSIGKVVSLAEFTPPTLAGHPAFFAFAALAAFSALWRAARGEWRDLLLAAGLLPLVFYTVRVVPLFVILAIPGTALTLKEVLGGPGRGRLPRRAALALVLAGALLLAGRQAFFAPRRSPLGWGVDARLVPSGAAETILAKGLSGRIYNDYSQGGYLMWRLYPGQKVFQDGRTYAYPPAFLAEVASFPPGHWPALLERYQIDLAIVGRGPHDRGAAKGRIFDQLGWKLASLDGASLLWVRPGTPDADRVGGDDFRLLRPWTPTDRLIQLARARGAELLAEIRRVDPARLLRVEEAGAFGTAAYEAGDYPLAERFFRAGLALSPGNGSMHFGLGVALEQGGKKEEAVREFGEVLRREKKGYWADQARQRLAGLAP